VDRIVTLEIPLSPGELRDLISEARLVGSTPERIAEGVLRFHFRELRRIRGDDPAATTSPEGTMNS